MKKVKRKYDSAHRQLLAGKTREQILESARRLFRDRGYTQTSIEEIAADAGVAVPTVYATYKGKRAILLQLLDEMEKRADASGLITALKEHAGDESAQLRDFIEFSVRLFAEDGGVIRIAELAGTGDSDVAALWQTGGQRRLETCSLLLKGWHEKGLLREGLTETKAVDILWAFSSPEFFRLLTYDRKWTSQQYCDWLYQLVLEQLLAPVVRSRPRHKEARRKL